MLHRTKARFGGTCWSLWIPEATICGTSPSTDNFEKVGVLHRANGLSKMPTKKWLGNQLIFSDFGA